MDTDKIIDDIVDGEVKSIRLSILFQYGGNQEYEYFCDAVSDPYIQQLIFNIAIAVSNNGTLQEKTV